MESIDPYKLAADPLTKAIGESAGKTVVVSGYVRSTDEKTISICKQPTSRSFIEYHRSSITAAFKDGESTKVTLLVTSDAEVRIVTFAQASGISGERACGCHDIGVQEARPLSSIHPALAELAEEMRAIKDFIKGSSGRLKCDLNRHDEILKGKKSTERIDLEYRNCLKGFPPEDDNYPFGRPL